MVTQVPFHRHGLSPDSADQVARVLAGSFLTSAGVGHAVEDELRAFFEVPHAILTNSWTNGAIATLMALGIGPGDEVIVPSMTFIASANVIELVGATPVFVDVQPADLLMDLDQVAEALSPRTRAVMPVHLYGQMVDVRALRALVGPEVFIIEDAAHCFEGTLNGSRPGLGSEAAIFSFYATKNLTCGEGGAVITRSDRLFSDLRQTVLHGMSAAADARFDGSLYRHWDMHRLGTKANLPDLLAALLPPQIASVERRRVRREKLAMRYRAQLLELTGVRLVEDVPGCVSARHLFPIGVPAKARDKILHKLGHDGVGATVNYRPVHRMAYYAERYRHGEKAFPVSSAWGESTLSLPLFPDLREEEQDYVIERLMEAVENASDK